MSPASRSKRPERKNWRAVLRRDFERYSGAPGVSGWIRRDAPQVYHELSRDPEAFVTGSRATILKERPKSRVFRRVVKGHHGMQQTVVVKQIRHRSFFRKLSHVFAVSPALRSLRGALILQENGIDTPVPIAAIEPRRWKDLGTTYFIAEEIEDGESLRMLWQTTLLRVPRRSTLRKRVRVLRDVASLCHRLHSMGIFHQDLKGTNILLQTAAPNEQRLFLVDVGDVTEPRCLRWRNRIRNLVQMCQIPGRFWSPREKAFFLKHYADLAGLSKTERRTLVRDVFAATRHRWNFAEHRPPSAISGGRVRG